MKRKNCVQINHISFSASDDDLKKETQKWNTIDLMSSGEAEEKKNTKCHFQIENKQQGVFIVVIAVGLKIDRIMYKIKKLGLFKANSRNSFFFFYFALSI